MKKKEPRWYILWFFTSGMWAITFFLSISKNDALTWIVAMQLLNIVLSIAAGIVNAHRYKKRHSEEEADR